MTSDELPDLLARIEHLESHAAVKHSIECDECMANRQKYDL